MNFIYGERETAHLSSRDTQLGLAIARIGIIQREVDADLFSSVVRHILGQQISNAALATLWRRLQAKVGVITVETVSALTPDELQQLGTTHRKAGYLYAFTQSVQGGELSLDSLAQCTDEQVKQTLVAQKGIGLWTAEMILLFGLGRPNILSFGDLGILRGLRMLHQLPLVTRAVFDEFAARYSPYGSTASLYLWAISASALPELRDPAAALRPPARARKSAASAR